MGRASRRLVALTSADHHELLVTIVIPSQVARILETIDTLCCFAEQ
jgi:hypothetical protein